MVQITIMREGSPETDPPNIATVQGQLPEPKRKPAPFLDGHTVIRRTAIIWKGDWRRMDPQTGLRI